jgi:antirestriction protein ArdC
MHATREEIQQQALGRALGNQALTNFPAIFAGFMAKGIAETDIRPRENVFTYHAWRALGRQVRRGEHGVKVTTFVTCAGKEDVGAAKDADSTDAPKRTGYRRPWTATVFHVSQTDPIPA